LAGGFPPGASLFAPRGERDYFFQSGIGKVSVEAARWRGDADLSVLPCSERGAAAKVAPQDGMLGYLKA
jgi:hypothetical protein